jgi:hypothetical protein
VQGLVDRHEWDNPIAERDSKAGKFRCDTILKGSVAMVTSNPENQIEFDTRQAANTPLQAR